MAKDIDTYRLIKQFVDWWCRRYYKHSQPEDREDMASEVALIAFQNPSPAEDEKKKPAWFWRVAQNVVFNWSRRAKRHLDDEKFDEMQFHSPLPEDDVLFRERDEVIYAAIQKLSPIHRRVIWLFYYEGLSLKAISDTLSCPQGTVRRRLVDARRQLQKRLSHYLFENLSQSKRRRDQ